VSRLAIVVLLVISLGVAALPASGDDAPPCGPRTDPVVYEDEVTSEDARTYRLLPFEVQEGTTRVEITYDWGEQSGAPATPLTATTVDLGLWDQDGAFSAEGFRGWSGSRHRDIHVQADSAERGYHPGAVEAGRWHAEVGIAAVSPDGGWYEVEIRCLDEEVGEPPLGTRSDPDPVDPDHVARSAPGWYHGDLHMHAYHSHPDAPDWDEFVAFAREQQLDFLPVTEYTTDVHWYELGSVQRAHPDLLVWPSREIITYHGHAIALGETWDHVEYRHGFRDITMAGIQQETLDGGALFQVAHPTTFEGPVFENLCRGCPWDLDAYTDWASVDTIEIQTGPAVVRPGPQDAGGQENPFMASAIDMWEDLLNEGHFITAVGGSDDKWAGERRDEQFDTISPHGVPATAVWAQELSREALVEGLREGRAYVRNRGVAASPALELEAVAADGEGGTFGTSFAADEAEVSLRVTGAAGQVLRIVRNGETADLVPITGDDVTHTWTAERDEGSEGPLGTWWRVETQDHEARTTVANPIFLTGADPGGRDRDREPGAPDGDDRGDRGDRDDRDARAPESRRPAGVASAESARAGVLPTTGGGLAVAVVAVAGGAVLAGTMRRR
jgi:hypothetical protein